MDQTWRAIPHGVAESDTDTTERLTHTASQTACLQALLLLAPLIIRSILHCFPSPSTSTSLRHQLTGLLPLEAFLDLTDLRLGLSN